MAACVLTKDQPFRVLKQLGGGGYGTVHLVDHKRLGTVAYKTCPGDSTDRKKLEMEAEQHRILNHPNVVILYDIVFNSKSCGLFIEYMKYGSVDEFIKRFKVPSEWRIQIVYEAACGMTYLHGNQPAIIHGNLSSQNILIGEGFDAKIADFGIYRTLKENYENSTTLTTIKGKPIYIAPECFKDPRKRKSEKFDVYGFAISAWEILSQKRAYHDIVVKECLPTYVKRGERPDMKELDMSIPNPVKKLIEKCWHEKEKKRPGFEIIKEELFVYVSKTQSELRRAYISLMDQEKMMDLSDTLTITMGEQTSGVTRSTDSTVLTESISLLNVIGQGGYSVVYKAKYFGDGEFRNFNSGRIVAYKKLNVELMQDEGIDIFKKEAELHLDLKHKNIIKCLGTIFERGNYGIIFEFAEYGELRGYLRKNDDLSIKLSMLRDVALGMEYLHGKKQNPVIHGDLKIQNILVGQEKVAKICDFGFSQIKNYSQSRSVNEVRLGTVTHIPPEYWNDNMLRKTEPFDVYSFGICAWEIITLERPFANASSNSGIIKTWVLSGLRPPLDIIPSEVPERIRNLIRECWSMEAGDRPSFTDIVSHCCETEQIPNDLEQNTSHETEPIVYNENPTSKPPTPRLRDKLPTSEKVRGITSLNNELYVVTSRSPDIDVYDIDTLIHRRKIRVEGLARASDIVAHASVLYVSEFEDNLIHRIQLSDETSSHWPVNSGLLTMSINEKGNVVVSCWDRNKIIEYTPTGNCVREIQVDAIDRTIYGLLHAIQLDDDRFLVCHTSPTHDRVCVIDSYGRMIESYGGSAGSGIGQINYPRFLAIDRNGSILVADSDNNRIIQLNASLEFIREFIPGSVGLQKPMRMHLHENTRRLYIAEFEVRNIAIFDL